MMVLRNFPQQQYGDYESPPLSPDVKALIATQMEVLMAHSCKCCGSILSLVQFLFSIVNNRIAK